MPKGIPVGTLAIGEDGAINAALLASSIIAIINNVAVKNNLRQVEKKTKSELSKKNLNNFKICHLTIL